MEVFANKKWLHESPESGEYNGGIFIVVGLSEGCVNAGQCGVRMEMFGIWLWRLSYWYTRFGDTVAIISEGRDAE